MNEWMNVVKKLYRYVTKSCVINRQIYSSKDEVCSYYRFAADVEHFHQHLWRLWRL